MLTVEVGAKKYLIRLEHRIVASKFFNFVFNHTQVVKPVLAVLRVFCFGRPLSFLQELKLLTVFFLLSVVDPAPSNMGSSVGKSCPSLPVRFGGVSRLMVTPRVSGLERSQEKNLEPHFPEPVSSSTSSPFFPGLPSHSPVTVPRSSPVNGGSRHNSSPPLSKPKPSLPPRTQSIYNRYETPTEAQFLLSSL